MFVDAVLANVLVFAVGQAFAWLFLRTGRFWVGAAATTALWASMDCWLVQRFLLATPAEGQQLAVLILQATALSVTTGYLWARLRKRLGAPVRTDRFRQGTAELLQGKLHAAESTFRQLVWSNPWDVSAWISRGDALRRLGVPAKARRCYRRAAGADANGRFADLLAHRVKQLQTPPSTRHAIEPHGTELVPRPVARQPKRARKAASGS